MIIREATERDCDVLCEIMDEVDRLHRKNLPGRFKRPEGPVRDREYLLSVIADPDVRLYVAVEGERLIGVVQVLIRETRDIPILVRRRYGLVENLVVREGLRRKGIGSALMERALEWARSRGATEFELNVFEFNRSAIAFYRKLGYTTISRYMGRALG